MHINKHIILFLGLSISIICGSGCIKSSFSHQNKSYKPNNMLEEYVSRVGKRLLIVTANPTLSSNPIFTINNRNLPELTIDYAKKAMIPENDRIIISKGLLNYLQDEAELASILAIAIENLEYEAFKSRELKIALTADQRIIEILYKAGYDPQAFLDLQQEYLLHKGQRHNWLKFLFAKIDLNHLRVKINKQRVACYKDLGLIRGKPEYLSNIYLQHLPNFDR